MAYIRDKKIKGNKYYYLVRGKRVEGKVQQKVICYIGKHPGELGTTGTKQGETIKATPQPFPPGTRTWSPEATTHIEDRPGVYRFFNSRGELVYVGISAELGSRLRRWQGAPTPNPEHSSYAVRPDVQRDIKYFHYIYTKDIQQAERKEANIIARYNPPGNRTRGGGWHDNPGSGRRSHD